MPMLLRLFILFCTLPLVELWLLLQLAEALTASFAFGLVIVTGIVGAWLARREARRLWFDTHARLQSGELPADALGHGLMIFLAGALLITPGMLTDVVGFSLLIPPVRRWLMKRYGSGMVRSWVFVGPTAGQGPAGGFASHPQEFDAAASDSDAYGPNDHGPNDHGDGESPERDQGSTSSSAHRPGVRIIDVEVTDGDRP